MLNSLSLLRYSAVFLLHFIAAEEERELEQEQQIEL